MCCKTLWKDSKPNVILKKNAIEECEYIIDFYKSTDRNGFHIEEKEGEEEEKGTTYFVFPLNGSSPLFNKV